MQILRTIFNIGITIRQPIITIVVVLSALAVTSDAIAQKTAQQEHEVKAVFLFNFVQFVEWPPDAFPEKQSPITIGIIGKDPFGRYLDETIKGEVVNGHPLVVRRFNKPEEVKGCHILFFNIPRAEQQRDALAKLKGQHILTVSDTETFIQDGGMIRFVTDENKIRFQVNLAATKEEALTISSKLLRLAEVVTP